MKRYLLYLPLAALFACNQASNKNQEEESTATAAPDSAMTAATPQLPAPYATPSAKKFSKVIGWPEGKTPTVPTGFTVTEYAADLQNPRWIYVAPNGDILIAESNSVEKTSTAKGEKAKGLKQSGSMKETSANQITLLRDANKDGKPELRETFLTGLNQPFGMLVIGNNFYVGNTDGVVRYAYQPGQTKITAGGAKNSGTARGRL